MADLINRQAAINALIEELEYKVEGYWDGGLNRYDVEAVLNALPPVQPKSFRVIDKKTGKEADPYEIALTEEWAKGLIYCDMEGFAILEDGTLMLTDECSRYEFCPEGRFEVTWNG